MVGIGYAGYKQGDEQSGYYPGRGIGGGKPFIPPLPPAEFTDVFSDFDRMFDGLVRRNPTLPALFWTNYKKQLLSLFVVSGGYGDQLWIEADQQLRNLAGDNNDYPGAFDVDYNVNPVQWLKDPGKSLKNQLKEIYRSTVNWEDVDRKAQDDFLSDVLLGRRAGYTSGSLLDRLNDAAIKSIEQRVEKDTRKKTGVTSGSFSLELPGLVTGYAPTDTHSGGVINKPYDSGLAVAQVAINTFRVADAPTKARGPYNNFISTSMQGIDDELSAMDVATRNSFFANAATTLGISTSDVDFMYETFKLNKALAKSASAFVSTPQALLPPTIERLISTTLPDPRMGGKLTRVARVKEGITTGATPITVAAVDNDLKQLRAYMTSTAKNLDMLLGGAGVAGSLAEMRHHLSSHPSGAIATEEQLFFEATFKEFEESADAFFQSTAVRLGYSNMEGYTNHVISQAELGNYTPLLEFNDAYTRFRKGARTSVRGVGGGVSRGLSEKDMFSGGILTNMHDAMARHYLMPKSSGADRKTFLQVALSDPSRAQLTYRIIGVHSLVRDRFYSSWVRDVANTLENNKVTSLLMTTRVFGIPIYAATPRNIAASFLSRNHYFGLKIDPYTYEPYTEGAEFVRFYNLGNKWVNYLYKRGILANTFDLKFTLPGGSLPISLHKVVGGRHLGMAQGLSNFLRIDNNAFNQYVTDTGTFELALRIAEVRDRLGLTNQQALVVNFLKVNPASFATDADYINHINTLFGELGLGKVESEAFAKRLLQFRRFLESRNSELLNLFTATGELDESKVSVLFGLLDAFEARRANVSLLASTRSAVGLLEKLTQQLNIIFNELLKRAGLPGTNISVTSFFFVKTRIKQILVNRLFAYFGVALSSLSGPVGFALSLIGIKIIDKLTSVGKHLLKFEFGAIGAELEAAFVKTGQMVGKILLIFSLVLLLPMIFTSSIISNISPIEPYSYNNIEAGITPGPAPQGQLIAGACSNGCIFAGSIKSAIGSYSGNESGGHGSNNYWDNVPSSIPQCGINIPTNGGGGVWGVSKGPTAALDDSGDSIKNYCRDKPTSTDYYGRAWDILPTAGAGTTVCAPSMAGVAYWKVGQSLGQYNGFMVDVSGFNSADELVRTIRYVHLGTIVRTGDKIMPGDSVGTVWDWGSNSHVHLEVKDINGSILSPESTGMCAGS